MELQKLLAIYMDKFGEENDIDTVVLSEDGEEKLKDLIEKAISHNEPISKKELEKLYGFNPDKKGILI